MKDVARFTYERDSEMLEERERESNFDLVAQENYFFKTRNQFEKFTNSFLGQPQQQTQQQPRPTHHQLNHQIIDSAENSLFNPEEAQVKNEKQMI